MTKWPVHPTHGQCSNVLRSGAALLIHRGHREKLVRLLVRAFREGSPDLAVPAESVQKDIDAQIEVVKNLAKAQ